MLPWQFKEWVWCLLPVIAEYVEKKVIAGNLRFKIVLFSYKLTSIIFITFCMSRQNGTGCQLVGEMGVGKMAPIRV